MTMPADKGCKNRHFLRVFLKNCSSVVAFRAGAISIAIKLRK